MRERVGIEREKEKERDIELGRKRVGRERRKRVGRVGEREWGEWEKKKRDKVSRENK